MLNAVAEVHLPFARVCSGHPYPHFCDSLPFVCNYRDAVVSSSALASPKHDPFHSPSCRHSMYTAG